MSEFKFACPICGQHITADFNDTGSQINCPTCFRKIVVPQAPASADPKFILSAAEANKPRPQAGAPSPAELPPASPRKVFPVALAGLLILACVAGAALFVFRAKIFKSPAPPPVVQAPVEEIPVAEIPVPPGTNRPAWSMDLTTAAYPETAASGRIHGRDFVSGRSILDGGTLTLRHGNTATTELGLNIYLPARQPEDLAGKTLSVITNSPGQPWVVVRWKDGDQGKTEEIRTGYVLKVEFGNIRGERISGKIYVCLPDSQKSVAAGTFNAEIRRPVPPPPPPPR